MVSVLIFIVITALLSLITAYLYSKKNYSRRVLFKALSSAGFVFVGLFAMINNPNVDMIYAGGILIALLFGLMGDMLLSMHPFLNNKEAQMFNKAGMFSFLAGHIMYIGVFIYFGGFAPINIVYITIIPIILTILILTRIIDPGKIKPWIIVYGIFISVLLVQGVYLFANRVFSFSYIILFASALFTLSDLTLMFHNFSKYKAIWMMPLCLILYYSAQILFAYSIFLS